jgi:hypothetical protein
MHYLQYLDFDAGLKGATQFPLSTSIGAVSGEFSSYGSGYTLYITATVAGQVYGGSRFSQLMSSIVVDQATPLLNTGGAGATILGNQLDLSLTGTIGSGKNAVTVEGVGLQVRPGSLWGSTSTERVNNWLAAYSPGSYFKAYYRSPSDSANQYRELYVENASVSAGYVKYVASSGFVYDGGPYPPAEATALEAGQPLRFEFYASGDPNP